uniref:Myosin IXAa n=1 Tax=Sphaeramia orbicularis TaxID=375764 RepID=A0A673CVH5_9TELE
ANGNDCSRFENSEFTVRIYPGDLAEGTIYCPISARKTTTAAEAIERVIERLQLDRTRCYVLAEVKEFGGEEWILNPSDCPVQRMMLWPRVALEHRPLSGGEDYRFLLRQKNLDGSIHYGGSLQMWLQVTEERRRMVERGLLPQPESQDHSDLCRLSELNERSLLDNLRSRFRQEKIYTYVGSILIVINPFKFLPIYNPKYVKMYDNHTLGEVEPHIYAVADVAYHAMLQRQSNQCIVISGESGSGKTQSTNFLIHHLTALSQKGFASGVEQIILGAGPVLEAFGNAKTAHNNNSSRFGKFIQVNYQESGMVRGAYVEKYLLEKSRLVYQEHNERNYHVFYYLLAGTSEEERTAFHLKKPEEYHYLSQMTKKPHRPHWDSYCESEPDCFTVEGEDLKHDFERLQLAMEMVGFLPATRKQIFSLLSAILHLGNIRYKRKTYRDDSIDICNPEVLPVVSELLEVKEEMLFEALTTRKTVTVGEKLIVPYKLAEAGTVRDSMAKSLYSALFDWIVFRINHALLNIRDLEETTKILSIGVLDIFGFEDYENNSFEQFCINFANERLQHYFNQHIFKLEQEEYRVEGISWRNIDYIDNTGCIHLISKKPTALFHLLDEECNFPQATNQTLLDKFKRQHEGNSYIEFPAVMEPAFIIRHYAGKVKYGVKDFREKNTDHMRPDIVALLKSSKNAFICGLIGIDPSATFRWAVLRAYFRALVAFREAGKRHTQKKTGHDDAAPCAVLKSVDSFSFLQHPVHQRSLEILQRCKEEKYSKAETVGMRLTNISIIISPGLGWNGRVGRQSRPSPSSSTTEEDGIFVNSASSKLLERAHDILMRNKTYKSRPLLPKHLLNVKSLKYLSNLTLHDRITKSLLHLHKKKKPPSISAQFQASLNKLMETLGQSEPYFVKCIRSNAEKLPLRFNDNLVLRQLRYTGMLETVRIRQSGYNIKYSFKDFIHHFHVLLPESASATKGSIQECLDQLDLAPDGYQVGKTMVFLREAERQRLQALLHTEVLRFIVLLQRQFRAQLERKQFVKMREAAICIQRWWRMYRPMEEEDEEEEEDEDYDPAVQEAAVLCLQAHWRGYRERQRFREWREAAVVLQRAWRMWLYRRCTAALVIQTAWRCHRAREAYLQLHTSVVQLQALSRRFLARQRQKEEEEQQEKLLQLQNGQVSVSPEEEESPEGIPGLDLSTWEDRSYEERERNLKGHSSHEGALREEGESETARPRESLSTVHSETPEPASTTSVVVRERSRTVDEPSQKTTRAKRESRRMRELEQAKFSLELLKVRATSGGSSSPSDERRWSVELVPPTTPPLLSPQGTPDSQSSKGSFELLSMDEEPPKATEEIVDSEDPCSPVPSVGPEPEPYMEVVSTSPEPENPPRTEVSNTVAQPGSQVQPVTDPVAHSHPPKIENYLPTFYVPASEGSTVITRCPKETPLCEELNEMAVIDKLVRLNEEKEERQRNQQQQNEREMMEQIRQQKEVLERQRLFFAQYERDMFEKQRGEALTRIKQSRQGGQDVGRTATSGKPLRPSSLLIDRTTGSQGRTQSESMAPSAEIQPQLPHPPASAPREKLKDSRPVTEGWAPKLTLETRDGGGARVRPAPKKVQSNQGTTVNMTDKPSNIFFSPKDKVTFENLSPPCSPDVTLDRAFRDLKENKEPSPKVKRRRSVKISSVALEPAQWQNDALQILTCTNDYRSMNDFLMKKISDLDTEDSKKDTMVDVVFKKALKEFRLNIFNSYSTALAMDDGKSIRYKDLYALFEHILEKTMRQEQRDWSESPVKVWVNTFKVFLDEFMIEYKSLDSTLGKVPKPERKKRRKKDTDIVEEHNGHIFKSTQYSIPTYCEYCSSLIWMMDRACVCKLCRYACHRKCCQKMTTKCSKKFDPELSSRQFGVEVSRLTSDERTVPLVVEKLINYIEMHGLYTEGIYRKSGSTNKIKELKQGLDTDVNSMNLDDYNIHVIASVFKQWLRDLPNPLMTFELYGEFIRAMALQDKKEMIRGVYSVIDQLSRTHLNTLERLIFHLVRIALQEETNRMSANALAIVFAPCILRCPDTIDPLQSVQDIGKTTACVELIICEQMNKYKVRLKDINTLEFAENKAKCRLTLIRRSMGKGHIQRLSYHTPSPPVSPRLPPGKDAVIEESGGEEGAESFSEISEHQQAAMQQEERVLTEQIENLQKEKEELTFEMLTLEPRASDDETLESEASIGTADSSENLNVDSEGTISDFSGTGLLYCHTVEIPRQRVLRRQPDSLDSVDSCSSVSSFSSSSHFNPSSSSSSSTTRRFRFHSKSASLTSSGPSQGHTPQASRSDTLDSCSPTRDPDGAYDEKPQFTSRGTFNPEKGKQKLKGTKHSTLRHTRDGGGHSRDPPDLPQQLVLYGSNEFMV